MLLTWYADTGVYNFGLYIAYVDQTRDVYDTFGIFFRLDMQVAVHVLRQLV